MGRQTQQDETTSQKTYTSGKPLVSLIEKLWAWILLSWIPMHHISHWSPIKHQRRSNAFVYSSLLHIVGTKVDQKSNGQCGQASESQPEVHGPLSGAQPPWGARPRAFLVSDVPRRPCFPKRGPPSGEGVVSMGNSTQVWSKFIFALD